MKKSVYIIVILVVFILNNLTGQNHTMDSLRAQLYVQSMHDTTRVRTLNSLANEYNRTSSDSIFILAKEADSISDVHNFISGKAQSATMIALYYKNNLRTDSACKYYHRALEKYRVLRDSIGIAKAQAEIAVVLGMQQDFNKAILYNDSALVVFEGKDLGKDLASAYIDRGIFYVKIGNFSKAKENYQKAQLLYETISDSVKLALLYTKMSSVYKTYRNYEKSFEMMYKSIAISESINDQRGLVDSYYYLAVNYSSTGGNDTAIILWDKALEIARKINYTHGIIDIQNQAGIINFTHAKNKDKALRYLEDSYAKSKQLKYKNGINIATHFLAKLYWIAGDLEKAKMYVQESHHYAELINKKKNLANSYYLMSKIYSKAHDYKKAYNYMESYKIYYDSVFNDVTKNKLLDLEYKFRYEHEKRELELEQQRKDAELKAIVEQEKRTKQLAISIALILILLSFGLTIIYRIRQKQKRTELARTKAEVENRLLRVQMNPHFMFNSLNSVQSYIARNENELAEDFLSRFALLTRMILNNSREEFVLLSDEIEILNTYLSLEQQRFNQAFDYTISIDDEIDEEAIKISPMLLQPFVENAIIHGVAPKKEGGKLDIHISLSDDKHQMILCTIEDNGIGRTASAKVNKGIKHKSLGMQVTGERLALISEQTKMEASIEIIDLYTDDQKAAGTRVEVRLPIAE